MRTLGAVRGEARCNVPFPLGLTLRARPLPPLRPTPLPSATFNAHLPVLSGRLVGAALFSLLLLCSKCAVQLMHLRIASTHTASQCGCERRRRRKRRKWAAEIGHLFAVPLPLPSLLATVWIRWCTVVRLSVCFTRPVNRKRLHVFQEKKQLLLLLLLRLIRQSPPYPSYLRRPASSDLLNSSLYLQASY